MPTMPDITISEPALIWMQFVLIVIVGLALKDMTQNFVAGLMFRMNSQFRPGDKVIIDNQEAIISFIGIRETIFVYQDDSNNIIWRYVSNSRIPTVKLEKIIKDSPIAKED